MKRIISTVIAFGLWTVACGSNRGPTGSDTEDLGFAPGSAAVSGLGTAGGSALGLNDINCGLLDDARIRFSDPGFINFNKVGMFIALRGMPEGRKRLRLWWDYDGAPHQFIDIAIDGDRFEDTLEHEYAGLDGEANKKVRIELTSDSAAGHCVRVRHITVAPEVVASKGSAPASTVVLFTENFSSLSGGSTGAQCGSGNTVHAFASVTGWSGAGVNPIHGVQSTPGNHAVSLFMNNVYTMTTTVAANQAGKTYTVRFKAGPSVWAACGQATAAGDGLIIQILRPDNSVLASHSELTGVWANVQTLTSGSFTYVGDGTGDIRIRIRTINDAAGRFGGAIDDISIEG